MKAHATADDRQRVIHALIRETSDEDSHAEHLSTEDLAALVSGTLFKTECSRIENHLLSCHLCAELAHRIQLEFEAGVVPILLRRAASSGQGASSLSARLTRRWSPWVLGVLAAVIVLIVSMTSVVQCGNETRSLDRDLLVYLRLGTPFSRQREGKGIALPIEPGSWLQNGQPIEIGPGDWVEAIDRQGEFWRVTPDRQYVFRVGNEFSQMLAKRAWQDRNQFTSNREMDLRGNALQKEGVHIVHPRQEIYRTRPRLRWATSRSARVYYLSVVDSKDGSLQLRRQVKGLSLPWPDDVLPLRHGASYRIEIRLKSFQNQVTAAANFSVVDGKKRLEIESQLQALGKLVGRGPNILRAELLRQDGFHAECREELERLRITQTENVALLARLRLAFEELGLVDESRRMSRLIAKRR